MARARVMWALHSCLRDRQTGELASAPLEWTHTHAHTQTNTHTLENTLTNSHSDTAKWRLPINRAARSRRDRLADITGHYTADHARLPH